MNTDTAENDSLRELQKRLNTAAERLQGLIESGEGYGASRLQGKREGVLLSESYVAEMLRTSVIPPEASDR